MNEHACRFAERGVQVFATTRVASEAKELTALAAEYAGRINALAPLKLAEALADNVANSEQKLMAFQSSQMAITLTASPRLHST